jgi:hypothetical protein
MKETNSPQENAVPTALERAQRLEQEFAQPKQLKLWHEDMRGISKRLSASALFAVRDKRMPRERHTDRVVASLQNVSMKYSGVELDQDDHLVFMQLVHFARKEPLGVTVRITGRAALKELGWDTSKESYDRLRDSYKRLLEGTVYIDVDMVGQKGRKKLYGAHLLNAVTADELMADTPQAEWTIKLNPDLANLLTGDEMTMIEWVRHYKLSPLARWLNSFYSTHESPLPYKAATLGSLCGSTQADERGFRFRLKKALEELKAGQFISEYTIGPKPSYLVSVKRLPVRAALG